MPEDHETPYDITAMEKGELIASLSEAGATKERIAGTIALRDALIKSSQMDKELQELLADPAVSAALKEVEEHRRKEERRKTILSTALGVVIWGGLIYLVFVRPFTG